MTSFERAEAPAGHRPQRVPVIAESGLAEIDPWWGTIQPHELHPDLPTWGEREVIAHLDAAHPGLRDRLLDDTGALRKFVNLFVADDDVRYLQGLDTPVPDGETVSIIPAVAGG